MRRGLERTSSSGRSNDAGMNVTVIMSRSAIGSLPDDVDESGRARDDTARRRAGERGDHALARERERDGVLLAEVDGHLDAILHLAVDLDDERLGLDGEQRRVGDRPGRRVHAVGPRAPSLPEARGHVGHHRGKQREQRRDRLVDDVAVPAVRRGDRLGDGGVQLSEPGDRGVEPPLVEVLGDRADGLVHALAHAASASVCGPSRVGAGAVASRQSWSRNRRHPSITRSVWSVQSKASAGGPAWRWKSRRASAPTSLKYFSGVMRLPLDLDIFVPSIRIIPWVNRRDTGSRSSPGANPVSMSARMKNLVYSRCKMACSMPPMYCPTGIHAAASSGSKGSTASGRPQKRRKYQLESTNVSSVSVSRSAGPPQAGQVVSRNARFVASGERPVGSMVTSSGATTGSWSTGTGTTPQPWQYTIGMGQPQNRCRETSQSRSR